MRAQALPCCPTVPPTALTSTRIENLWGYVGARVQAQGLTSFDAFKQAVIKELVVVPTSVLHNLFNSMPSRIAQVIDMAGDKTKY